VVPLVYGARLTTRGIRTMGALGLGDIRGDNGYAAWLGRKYREEIWGQVFTNAMAMAIRLVLGVVGS
jgi:hypothetical protein